MSISFKILDFSILSSPFRPTLNGGHCPHPPKTAGAQPVQLGEQKNRWLNLAFYHCNSAAWLINIFAHPSATNSAGSWIRHTALASAKKEF